MEKSNVIGFGVSASTELPLGSDSTCYDSVVFMCLWLLSARHTHFPSLTLWLLCAQSELTLSLSFSYAHGHNALNGRTRAFTFSCHVTADVSTSRATGSFTRTFSVPVSRDSYCTCMCHGDPPRLSLCHDYVFSLMPLTHLRWWRLILAGLRYAHMLSERFVCRFFLCPVFYPTTLPCLPLLNWTLFLSCTFTALTPLCTCISQTCIYTGLEMGRSPSSIYFATTLKLWPERSHVLSLDCSSSLAKATALHIFAGVHSPRSVYSLTGSEVQPTQCTSVRS